MANLTPEDLEVIKELVREAVAESTLETMSSVFEEEREVEAHIVAQIVAETYRIMAEQEAIKIAEAHGKMLEVMAMIEDIASRGELDVSTLGEETYKRAYALAVMTAERSVVRIEGELSKLKDLIIEAEMAIAYGGNVTPEGIEANYHNRYKWDVKCWEDRLRNLLKQEAVITRRLESERQRLANLRI